MYNNRQTVPIVCLKLPPLSEGVSRLAELLLPFADSTLLKEGVVEEIYGEGWPRRKLKARQFVAKLLRRDFDDLRCFSVSPKTATGFTFAEKLVVWTDHNGGIEVRLTSTAAFHDHQKAVEAMRAVLESYAALSGCLCRAAASKRGDSYIQFGYEPVPADLAMYGLFIRCLEKPDLVYGSRDDAAMRQCGNAAV